jgi:uncharacterized protein YdaU (DUF1376 family)
MSEPASKDAPAFDFYPERWTHGTRHMTKVERCDYIDLLCHQWTDDGLPANLDILARLLGYRKGCQIPVMVIEKFPKASDGKRRNQRLEVERQKQRDRREKAQEKARVGAAGRWRGSNTKALPEGRPKDAPSIPQAMLEGCSKHPPSIDQALHKQCPPPTSDPTPITERESTAGATPAVGDLALQADAIAASYCRHDSPVEVREIILGELERGVSPTELREGVLRCMAHIRGAPGGGSNRYVPKALKFFSEGQWRSPEAFQSRWQADSGRQPRHAAYTTEGATAGMSGEDIGTFCKDQL